MGQSHLIRKLKQFSASNVRKLFSYGRKLTDGAGRKLKLGLAENWQKTGNDIHGAVRPPERAANRIIVSSSSSHRFLAAAVALGLGLGSLSTPKMSFGSNARWTTSRQSSTVVDSSFLMEL